MGVDVDLDRGVHADNTKTSDDLGRVGDLLSAKQQLVEVMIPVVVEALEAVWREANRGSGSEIELARVKEIEEGVLQDFGPDAQVLKVGIGEATNDGVGNVPNSGLDREKIGRETAMLDFVLEELDEVAGDSLRGCVSIGVWLGLILVIGLDNGDDLFAVNWNIVRANAVFWRHDKVGLAVWWEVHHGNVMETLEGRHRSVDLDNNLSS